MEQRFLKSVGEKIPELVVMQNEPMKKHTTFRIGGPADFYTEPDEKQLPKLIGIAKECGIEVTIIGNGSNLLVSDDGIKGIVLKIEIEKIMNEIANNQIKRKIRKYKAKQIKDEDLKDVTLLFICYCDSSSVVSMILNINNKK